METFEADCGMQLEALAQTLRSIFDFIPHICNLFAVTIVCRSQKTMLVYLINYLHVC